MEAGNVDSPLKLALFDVDGTLTDTNTIDSECFVDALSAEFGIDSINEDWSAYTHTTDRGILTELLQRAWSREPDEESLAAHRRRFVALLSDRMPKARAIPGAVDFLERVREDGWSVVLCTGAWGDSARLKLARAGFPHDLLLASCDLATSREAILQAGIEMAASPCDSIVVFGDAVWDIRAARNLQLPFIAVATDTKADTLRREGADVVIDDYSDAASVLRLMAEARAPR